MTLEKKTHYFIFASMTLVSAFVFRNLILNITTGLLDWYDYPYYVWTMFQTIQKISTLSFTSFFSTNAFYPFESTLLFSDLLLPQSVIGFLFSLFTKNPILVFNLTFLSTILLNNATAYLMWQKVFSDKRVLWFVCMVTSVFPFLFLQLGHFQMITLWPLYLGIAILFNDTRTIKWGITLGLLVTVQFLASVYLAVFLLSFIGIWGVFTFFRAVTKDKKQLLIFGLVTGVVFSVTCGPILSSYLKVKNAYEITRNYGEYVLYAAQPSDYLFNAAYNSELSKTTLFQKINSYDWHFSGERMGSPGILILVLAFAGLGFIKNTHKEFQIIFPKSILHILFLTSVLVGYVFSLGPKLTINGSFTSLPLPYAVFLKTVPLFEPIRATGRWALLFYLGLIYFAGVGLTKLLKKININGFLLVGIAFMLYCYEMVPLDKTVASNEYYSDIYEIIEQRCLHQKAVLLEYPLGQDTTDINVATNLSYKTTQLLATLHHKCFLVNGYAGYDPKDYSRFEQELTTAVNEKDEISFKKLLEQRNVSLFKLNKHDLYKEKVTFVLSLLKTYPNVTILADTEEATIVALN